VREDCGLALAKVKGFDERASESSMDARPVLFSTDSDLGLSYLVAIELAGDDAS
jgi:hypothetical protein